MSFYWTIWRLGWDSLWRLPRVNQNLSAVRIPPLIPPRSATMSDTANMDEHDGEEMKHSFKLLLSMKKEPGGQPLYYKSDGQRFSREKTVKLNTQCQYRMDLSFTPPRAVESVNFNGVILELHEVTRDSTASAYSTFFQTQDFDMTKKGHRREVPVFVALKDLGEMRLVIQTKCYDKDNVQHSEWGSHFHCIEYLCEELDCQAVNIVKETFR